MYNTQWTLSERAMCWIHKDVLKAGISIRLYRKNMSLVNPLSKNNMTFSRL